MQNKNPLVLSLRQRLREWTCDRKGHAFYVLSGGYYVGMAQAHCFRCGIKDPHCSPNLEKWIVPLSAGITERTAA